MAEAEARGRTLYLNPSAGYSRESAGFTEFFQAKRTLPLSGRFKFLKQAGAPAFRVTESEGAFSLWHARASLRRAFYRVMASQERISLYAAGAKDMDNAIRVLRDREREGEGEGSKFDRLRAERKRAELLAEIAPIKAGSALERAQLPAFLPPATPVAKMESPPIPLAANESIQRAMAAREDFRAEQRRAGQFRFERQATEKLRFPEPVLSAGLTRADLWQRGIEVIQGRGVRATVNGRVVLVGNARLLRENGVEPPEPDRDHAGITIFVAVDVRPVGILELADQVRPGAKEATVRLKASGIRNVVMLTGDSQRVALRAAAELGVDEVEAELLAEHKVDSIARLQSQGYRVAMVGDGINDAPALARTDVGIAMGARGTQAALEAADIALMTDDLGKIVLARTRARRSYLTIQENLFVGVGVVHVLGITAAARCSAARPTSGWSATTTPRSSPSPRHSPLETPRSATTHSAPTSRGTTICRCLRTLSSSSAKPAICAPGSAPRSSTPSTRPVLAIRTRA